MPRRLHRLYHFQVTSGDEALAFIETNSLTEDHADGIKQLFTFNHSLGRKEKNTS